MGLQHTEHVPVRAYDADLRHSDAVIDSDLKPTLLLARIEPGATQRHCGNRDLLWEGRKYSARNSVRVNQRQPLYPLFSRKRSSFVGKTPDKRRS
jgi:hypothetical protein